MPEIVSTPPTQRPPLAGFFQIVQRIWERYNKEFKLLVSISTIAALVQIVLQFFPLTLTEKFYANGHFVHPSLTSWVFISGAALIGLVLSIWGSLALYYAVAHPEETTSVAIAFRRGGALWWKSLTTSLLLGLILVAGFILLIIPGIYWAGIYGLASYLVFKEKVHNMAALRRSAELVQGYWWAVFWRQLLFGFGYGFGLGILSATLNQLSYHFPGNWALAVSGTLNGILYVLILPIAALYVATVYEALVVAHQNDRPVKTPPPQA